MQGQGDAYLRQAVEQMQARLLSIFQTHQEAIARKTAAVPAPPPRPPPPPPPPRASLLPHSFACVLD